jgi:hypothetical protein
MFIGRENEYEKELGYKGSFSTSPSSTPLV